MTTGLAPVVAAVTGGARQSMGWYRYQVDADTWTWSSGMYAIHGFEPGEIVPTTQVFLAHKHPDDRVRSEQMMEAVLTDGEPFCCRHRLIDAQQNQHVVVSIGSGSLNDAGQVTEVNGYLIDITNAAGWQTQDEVRLAVAETVAHRAVIEQAKGALMLANAMSADDAFAVLQWHSSHANVKLREVAYIVTGGLSKPFEAPETPNQRVARLLSGIASAGR